MTDQGRRLRPRPIQRNDNPRHRVAGTAFDAGNSEANSEDDRYATYDSEHRGNLDDENYFGDDFILGTQTQQHSIIANATGGGTAESAPTMQRSRRKAGSWRFSRHLTASSPMIQTITIRLCKTDRLAIHVALA